MTRGNRSFRGLALALCLCLMVPYLPMPGHAEGCGHVHGEGCCQEVTSCVHTHEEDCWSTPEKKDAGEEPDACAHVCSEDTGCVTKKLNCPHVHDDTCGEQLQEKPEPEPETPKNEEPRSEPPQLEEPKQEGENQLLVISRWEWVDEEEVLDPETGVLCLSAEEPILFEEIAVLLPKAILATVGEGSQTVPLDHWDPKDYPQETGANSGSYQLEATLPEGYTLSEDAAPLTLHLEFAQAQALTECGHENVNMDTGMCKDCKAQVYVAKIGDTGYATMEAALTAAQEKDTACTVTLLCDVSESGKTIESGTITLDLNGKKWDLLNRSLVVDGGDLTLTTSIPNGKINSLDGKLILKKGTLTINGGEYESGDQPCIGTEEGSLRISGGTFISRAYEALRTESDTHVELSGGSFSGVGGTVVADDRSAAELLAAGYAFYSDAEGCNIVDASGEGLFGTVYVLHNHPSHTFDAATCKCVCGLYRHLGIDMDTGKCSTCQTQVYVAKIGDTGYATLKAALTAAQEKDTACTITLLCDVLEPGKTIENETFTLDLNGKKWDLLKSSLVVDGGDLTLTTSMPNGKINCLDDKLILKKGTLTINGGEYESGDQPCIGTEEGSLRISGGTFISRGFAVLSVGIDTYVELSGGSFSGVNGTVAADDRSAAELLAAGYAFYSDAEGSNIVDVSGETLFGTVYVLHNHPSHTFDAATCKCACGLYRHPGIDMDTGKCSTCQTQVYVAKIESAGYRTLEAALKAAETEKGCTVTMLSDVTTDALYIEQLNATLDLNGKKIKKTGYGNGSGITVVGGVLKIDDSSEEKNGEIELSWSSFLTSQGGKLLIYGGKFSHIFFRSGNAVSFYGGTLTDVAVDTKLLDLLAPGYAAYSDANGGTVLDASTLTGTITGPYYVLPHVDIYDPAIDQCPCGRKLLQVTMVAPKAAKNLTYNGQSQNLAEPGSATGGKLMYSLAEDGTYTETIPTGKNADTYTVWYYVEGEVGKYYNTEKQSMAVTIQKKDLTPNVTIPDRNFDGTKEVRNVTVTLDGKEDGDELTYDLGPLEFDAAIPGKRTAKLTGTPKLEGQAAGNYNLKAPTGLTGEIKAISRYLDVTDSLPNADSVTIDGEEYPVKAESGKRYVMLPETGSLLTVYTYETNADNKAYPDTMRVFAIDRQDTGSTLTKIQEFENLLAYEGCSIRLNGTKGIRMITSISQSNKKALAGNGLAGCTLVEYGTVITRKSALGGKTLNLQNVQSNNYNYAYSKANKKDPVFKTENGRAQYTNVLVNFQPADYRIDLVLRPYIKLLDASGNEVVLYGGTVTRSIYYIAQQNIGDYKPGSAGYKYLQEILNG